MQHETLCFFCFLHVFQFTVDLVFNIVCTSAHVCVRVVYFILFLDCYRFYDTCNRQQISMNHVWRLGRRGCIALVQDFNHFRQNDDNSPPTVATTDTANQVITANNDEANLEAAPESIVYTPFICVCIHICVHVYVCICLCIYVHICACMYVCMYMRAFACAYMCMHIYVCIYMCVFAILVNELAELA